MYLYYQEQKYRNAPFGLDISINGILFYVKKYASMLLLAMSHKAVKYKK
jgi:hypothetical protein